jgi:hypothetical protein
VALSPAQTIGTWSQEYGTIGTTVPLEVLDMLIGRLAARFAS